MTKLLEENATLVERHDLDRTLSIFRIRPDAVPPPSERWFTPGQYVTLGMSVKEGPETHAVQRAYSIASDPGDRDALEFYIRLANRPQTDRPLTYLVWPLPVGARVNCGAKIVGRFTLEQSVGEEDRRLKVFVAAGTGIAPFVSMVRAARRSGDQAALGRMAVLHGVSRPHELAYRAELEEGARTSGLRYLPTVSRPAEHPEWTGAHGRVEAFFDAQHVVRLEANLGLPVGGLSPEQAVVFVCGFRGTIAETTRRLLRRGFVPEDRRLRRVLGLPDEAKPSLFFEQYDLEPVFDPDDQALIEELRRDVFGR
jgi:ferredoxin--NADP+ reductase